MKENDDDKNIDARIIFCNQYCVVAGKSFIFQEFVKNKTNKTKFLAHGKFYVCKSIKSSDSLCDSKPINLNNLIFKNIYNDEKKSGESLETEELVDSSKENDEDEEEDEGESDENSNVSVETDDENEIKKKHFPMFRNYRPNSIRLKRRLPFETMNYGKRKFLTEYLNNRYLNSGKRARLPFETMNYGKRRLPFETMNYGKRRLPFETMNYGKRRLPYETMNYGKRSIDRKKAFEGYILGRSANEEEQ